MMSGQETATAIAAQPSSTVHIRASRSMRPSPRSFHPSWCSKRSFTKMVVAEFSAESAEDMTAIIRAPIINPATQGLCSCMITIGKACCGSMSGKWTRA